MTLSSENKAEFLIGLGVLNHGGATMIKGMTTAELQSAGDDICDIESIVTTHEVFADFVKTHGQPHHSEMTPGGYQVHEWVNVQFKKGQPRGSLYLMEFNGVSASYYAGG